MRLGTLSTPEGLRQLMALKIVGELFTLAELEDRVKEVERAANSRKVIDVTPTRTTCGTDSEES